MRLNRKNKWLLAGIFLLLYVSYAAAVSNTINYYKEYKEKKEILAGSQDISGALQLLLVKEKQLDQALSATGEVSEKSFQNKLLQELNTYSEEYQLKIIDFQEPHEILENGTRVSSYIFSLEGSFNGCIGAINKIENNPVMGDIRHLNFKKTKNYKTNTDELKVEVIMQKE
jgi:hypothetical protein